MGSDIILQVSMMNARSKIIYVPKDAEAELGLNKDEKFVLEQKGRDTYVLVARDGPEEETLKLGSMGTRKIIYIKETPMKRLALERGAMFAAARTPKGVELTRMRPSREDQVLRTVSQTAPNPECEKLLQKIRTVLK